MSVISLHLTPHETIQVLEAEGSRLVLEVRYDPQGRPPQRHLHPAQVEDFEVLSGELMVDIDGRSGPRSLGTRFSVPAGTVHRMWNPGATVCTVRWIITPPGRTLDMFHELDALHRDGGAPNRLALARVVARYGDELRLAGPAGRLLARVGR